MPQKNQRPIVLVLLFVIVVSLLGLFFFRSRQLATFNSSSTQQGGIEQQGFVTFDSTQPEPKIVLSGTLTQIEVNTETGNEYLPKETLLHIQPDGGKEAILVSLGPDNYRHHLVTDKALAETEVGEVLGQTYPTSELIKQLTEGSRVSVQLFFFSDQLAVFEQQKDLFTKYQEALNSGKDPEAGPSPFGGYRACGR